MFRSTPAPRCAQRNCTLTAPCSLVTARGVRRIAKVAGKRRDRGREADVGQRHAGARWALGDAARAERYFERFDLDKSGELDKKEFTRLLRSMLASTDDDE